MSARPANAVDCPECHGEGVRMFARYPMQECPSYRDCIDCDGRGWVMRDIDDPDHEEDES
jgi:DnaJ-class molecular chaperone